MYEVLICMTSLLLKWMLLFISHKNLNAEKIHTQKTHTLSIDSTECINHHVRDTPHVTINSYERV